MNYQYIIQNGKIEDTQDKLIFKGDQIYVTDPITQEEKTSPLFSSMLFPIELKKGSISFDVEFSDICSLSRCGFMLNYSFIDGVTQYYQVTLRNQMAFCSLDYFNGSGWEFLTGYGSENNIEKNRKYSLCLKINGNVLSFLVNDVPMFTYTKLRNTNGVCGIYSYNTTDTIVRNIHINSERPTAFSIMKFEKDFDELYQDVIFPTCEKYGYKPIRADECYTSSSIIEDIIREISSASLIIADVTMDNPNVFYELGYAHALNKPTILLADVAKRERLPFDISGYRTIFYSNSIRGKKEIEHSLIKYIENTRAQS